MAVTWCPSIRPAIWNKLDRMIKRGDEQLYLSKYDFIKYCETLTKEIKDYYIMVGMPRTIIDGLSYTCVSYKGQPVLFKGVIGTKLTKEELKHLDIHKRIKGEYIGN